MKKPGPPTVQQLVDVVKEYNRARELELKLMPPTGFPAGYKNQFMENLYDAATVAAAELRPALTVTLSIVPPGS